MNWTRKHTGRTTVAAVAAFTIAAAIVIPTQAQASNASHKHAVAASVTSTVKPEIVLVHGAWADGSSFAPVTALLQAQGYKVINAPNQLRSLKNDSDQLAAFLHDNTSGPVVLVGHSYGGAVITNAALTDPDVKALVYVDAYAPDTGETVQGLTGAQPGSLLGADPQTIFNFVQSPTLPAGDFDSYIKPEKYKAIFAASLPTAEANVLAVGQEPLALGALQEPTTSVAWKTIPSWFFIGSADKVIPPAEQRIMAARAHGHVTEANAPHLSMLAKPYQVEQTIVSAAKSVK